MGLGVVPQVVVNFDSCQLVVVMVPVSRPAQEGLHGTFDQLQGEQMCDGEIRITKRWG